MLKRSVVIILAIMLSGLLFGCTAAAPQESTSTPATVEPQESANVSVTEEPQESANAPTAEASQEGTKPPTVEAPKINAIALANVSEPDKNGYVTCDYNGIERKFILYTPEGLKENAPVVFMLHGYASSAKGFMDIGMNDAADTKGFAVVYVQGLRDPANTTGGACWNSGLTDSVNDDTGFLVSLAKYLQQTYGFNSAATFAAGFSNGAFMMYRLAVEAPDTFRAVASVSGTMSGGVWEERPEGSASVGILQINGTADSVVPLDKDGLYGDAPAIGGVIEFWKNADKLDKQEEVKLSDKAIAQCYSSEGNDNLVWYVEIKDGGHSWPTKDSAGFDANEVILDYFSNYVK